MSVPEKPAPHHRTSTRREATIARATAAIVGVGLGTLFFIAGLSAVTHDARKGIVMILVGFVGAGVGVAMAITKRWTHVVLNARERDISSGSHVRENDLES